MSSTLFDRNLLRQRAHKNWVREPRQLKQFRGVASDMPHHPELETEETIAWAMNQEPMEEGNIVIDVLEGNGTDTKWHLDVNDSELKAVILSAQKHDTQTASKAWEDVLRVFFIDTSHLSLGWLPGNFSIRPQQTKLLRAAGLSTLIIEAICSLEGRWARMGDMLSIRTQEDGKLREFEVVYRYQVGWSSTGQTSTSFTQFNRTNGVRSYFCINYPPTARHRLELYLDSHPSVALRDFFLDALAADECLKQWQCTIGDRRRQLLHFERRNQRLETNEDIDFNNATTALHYLLRDWHTLAQDLTDLSSQLGFLLDSHRVYLKHLGDPQNGWKYDKLSSTDESFKLLRSRCDNYLRWAGNYRERTTVRINLLFHLSNLREARTNTQIAASSAKIAEQTQKDSASMITIAAVTMFFLPGTFISAILSTTFFDAADTGLVVSHQWWILPATTIPLMVLVFTVWLGWQHWRFRIGKREVVKKVA